MSGLPDLRTPEAMARDLGLPSKRHIYRWIEEHNCPVYRVGRSIYLSPDEVAAWLLEQRAA